MPRYALATVQKFDHCFSLYDQADGAELLRVKLPDYPHEFVVDPAERFAFVGHYGIPTQFDVGTGGSSVFVIDLHSGQHVRTLRCWPYHKIHGLATDDAGRLYALSEGDGALLVFERPLEADTPDRVLDSGGHRSHLVTVTRDGQTAFSINLMSHTVTVLRPYEPASQPQHIHTGLRPEGNCLSADEKTLYVTNRLSNTVVAVDVFARKITAEAQTGDDPTRVVATHDDRLLVTNYGERSIGIYDLSLKPLGSIEVDAHPIAVHADAKTSKIYVTQKDASVAVIDPGSLKIERRFSVGAEPDGIAIIQLTA